MSRKSDFSAPGTCITFQLLPPSTVRMTVPFVPLAQTTMELTTDNPRNEALVSTDWTNHCAAAADAKNRTVRIEDSVFMIVFSRRFAS